MFDLKKKIKYRFVFFVCLFVIKLLLNINVCLIYWFFCIKLLFLMLFDVNVVYVKWFIFEIYKWGLNGYI